MTNLDTLMNSSLAAVAETDFQPFTDLNAGRQRKVLSVRNLSKAYEAQHKVLDGISCVMKIMITSSAGSTNKAVENMPPQ